MTYAQFFTLSAFLTLMTMSGSKTTPAAATHNPKAVSEAATDNCYPLAGNIPFQTGEELTYKVYYNLNFVWVPAGEVTFKMTDEGSRYHLSGYGQTYSSYEWFYKVRDYYDSYIDKSTLLPQTSIRHINENRYQLYDKVDFNQKTKIANYERGSTYKSVDKRGAVNLSDCMHDVLSIVYYCRTLDYSNAYNGQKFPAKLMLDEEEYSLQYTYLGRENKSIKDLGKFKTMRFTPQLVAGQVFNDNAKMKVWATDDDNRLPLMIESPVSVGSVKVVLKSWKNLKNPFSSKL
jgi:hypothetical protein